MPLTDDAFAALAECDPADVPRVFAILRQRAGDDVVRNGFFDSIGKADETSLVRPRFLQVSKFLETVGDPPPMLVDKLIPDYGLILIAGKPKFGKTFLALDVADCVCRGLPVFGEFAVSRSGPVCYLAMEDGKFGIANRLLGRGIRKEGAGADGRPFYMCCERFTVTSPEGLLILLQMLDEVKEDAGREPVLLFIDTGREGLGIRDWTDPAEVGEKLRPLREEVARKRCAVVIVVHNRKMGGGDRGDEIAGTNALPSSVDGWISDIRVEKRENGVRRHFLSTDNRSAPAMDFGADMDAGTLGFTYVAEEDLEGDRTDAAQEQRMRRYLPVVEAVRESTGQVATVKQIAERIKTGEKTIQILVREMVESGYLEETGDKLSQGTAGRPAPLYRTCKGVMERLNNGTGSTGEGHNSKAFDPADKFGDLAGGRVVGGGIEL